MTTPKQNQLITEKGNGKGYIYYQPEAPASIEVASRSLSKHSENRFTELSKIVGLAITYRSVLLEGSPGAGKSNVCHDIESSMVSIGVPLLRISVHINAGTLRHAQDTAKILKQYRSNNSEHSLRFFILDNADYGGYKGSSRTRTNAAQYAEQVIPNLIDAVEDENLTVVGTAHDEAWRQSKWTWDDPAIDKPANSLLDAFRSRYKFKGSMPKVGVYNLLKNRGADDESALYITRSLGAAGLLNFFYANHVDIEQYLHDEKQALNNVQLGRKKRYGLK